ncbi:Six-hairpin glycosidase-like protein [Aspergillus pseudodeflectus]|uniref:Six-hairpin glycosidase-like protein n=1 Tax=Aspergillus pseudodeflectus TaxID=176178 RepID=A0ABR4KG50_9EURO
MTGHWSEKVPWIWAPEWDDNSDVARILQFRKRFEIEQVPSQCLVHVSADTRYRLFVNGQSVCFGPAKSTLAEWNYETVDIAPFCTAGTNSIAARVLRYSPRQPGTMSFIRGPIPGFILYCESLDISTDRLWLCKTDDAVRILSPRQTNPALGPPLLLVNEEVDGTHEDCGWATRDYDVSTWVTAIKATLKTPMVPILEGRRLVPRIIPLLPEIAGRFSGAISCEGLTAEETTCWTDLVQNDQQLWIDSNRKMTITLDATVLTTAFLELHFQGGAKSRIRIRCAECFERQATDSPNPFARNKGDRTDAAGILVGYDDFYTVSNTIDANGSVYYEPFWFRTFRYVELQIETSDMPLCVQRFTYRSSHYPLDIKTTISHFPSKEAEKQWEISLNTLQNCMHETYEDCPYYEQNQFAMDARLQILFTYQLSHDDRLARKCMQEFYSSRRPDGLIETHFPSPFPVVNIPFFSLYWILMVHDHMMYIGDRSLVRRYLGTIDGILDHFAQRVEEDGLVGRLAWDIWPFVDWTKEWTLGKGDFRQLAVPPAYYRTGKMTYSSLIYAYVLQKAAVLCEYVGRHDTAAEYTRRAEDLNKAVVTHCFRADFLADGPDSPIEERSQHAQVFAVLSGALQGETAREVLQRALTDASFARCSYAMSFYVFEAARKVGIYDPFRDSLLDPWREMMHLNLTTWAESAAMPRSGCHGWSAVPIHDVVANVVGLRPGAPGFDTILFEPRREYWPKMEGTFAIGSGTLMASWEPGSPLKLTSSLDTCIEFKGQQGSVRLYNLRKNEPMTCG